ncbi:MAG: penicillin-binding transpeptidase domain-containing protein, partial [Candidatus Rokuibacteriota bacterium]
VVDSGTGHLAAIPGYAVGGKTGTAQKIDPATRRYSRAPGVLSFVGFAPVDDPRFVALVMLDEPRHEKWGSEAAAPIFSAIGREVLRYLEVAPRDVAPVQIVTGGEPLAPRTRLMSTAAVPDATLMPDVRGQTLRQALAALEPLQAQVQVDGRGRVLQQTPPAGAPLAPPIVARLTLGAGDAGR